MFIVEEVLRKMYLDFVKENFMELLKVGVFKIIYLNLFNCRKGVKNYFLYIVIVDLIIFWFFFYKMGILFNVKRLFLIRKVCDFEMSNLIFI